MMPGWYIARHGGVGAVRRCKLTPGISVIRFSSLPIREAIRQASWGKTQELETTKSGGIWYKHAAVYAVVVNTFGNTAILLNDIDLQAVVGGNQVTNAFMVTEVYIKENGQWKMAQLTFSHLLRPVRLTSNNN
jgi:hypothetical protein